MFHTSYSKQIQKIKQAISQADAVIVGAGAGLSTAAGYRYSGEIFATYFADFRDRFPIRDIYSGGFYPFPDLETNWAWWSRAIFLNRYTPIPNDTYDKLLDIVGDMDYFVITTNVDHCFQRSGFDKNRLFYTQGDYGLFQSSSPSGAAKTKTYDNEEIVMKMLRAQGFEISDDHQLLIPEGAEIRMEIPSELVPYCKDDGQPMTMNLRSDDTFVEDTGWHKASARYRDFLNEHDSDKVVYLELGVGGNTPVIIKYPFWKMTYQNPKATYICLNKGEAVAPREIQNQSICVNADIRQILTDLAE